MPFMPTILKYVEDNKGRYPTGAGWENLPSNKRSVILPAEGVVGTFSAIGPLRAISFSRIYEFRVNGPRTATYTRYYWASRWRFFQKKIHLSHADAAEIVRKGGGQ